MFKRAGLLACLSLCLLSAVWLAGCADEPIDEASLQGMWVPTDDSKVAWGDRIGAVDEVEFKLHVESKRIYSRIYEAYKTVKDASGKDVTQRTSLINNQEYSYADRVFTLEQGWKITFLSADKIKMSADEGEITLKRKPEEKK